MAYFTVSYTYSTDVAQLDAIRPQHRAFLGSRDEVVASGPLVGTNPGRALLLFRAEDRAAVEAIVNQDPFYLNGLVADRSIDEWNPVIGVFA